MCHIWRWYFVISVFCSISLCVSHFQFAVWSVMFDRCSWKFPQTDVIKSFPSPLSQTVWPGGAASSITSGREEYCSQTLQHGVEESKQTAERDRGTTSKRTIFGLRYLLLITVHVIRHTYSHTTPQDPVIIVKEALLLNKLKWDVSLWFLNNLQLLMQDVCRNEKETIEDRRMILQRLKGKQDHVLTFTQKVLDSHDHTVLLSCKKQVDLKKKKTWVKAKLSLAKKSFINNVILNW